MLMGGMSLTLSQKPVVHGTGEVVRSSPRTIQIRLTLIVPSAFLNTQALLWISVKFTVLCSVLKYFHK